MERGRLCITRLDYESVLIGDDIRVTAVRCEHGRVRLLIEAPKNIPIVREELTEEVIDEVQP